MEYTKYNKDQQKQWLEAQITDLERQHFEQTQFAAAANAAADVPAPDEADQSAEAVQARAMRTQYADQAAQHRGSALEAERRIATYRAVLSAIEGDKPKAAKRS